MSTLPIRTPHVAFPAVPSFARFFAGVAMILDVFAEAQAQANAMHKKYPFIGEE